jgi:hypothetical protein
MQQLPAGVLSLKGSELKVKAQNQVAAAPACCSRMRLFLLGVARGLGDEPGAGQRAWRQRVWPGSPEALVHAEERRWVGICCRGNQHWKHLVSVCCTSMAETQMFMQLTQHFTGNAVAESAPTVPSGWQFFKTQQVEISVNRSEPFRLGRMLRFSWEELKCGKFALTAFALHFGQDRPFRRDIPRHL